MLRFIIILWKFVLERKTDILVLNVDDFIECAQKCVALAVQIIRVLIQKTHFAYPHICGYTQIYFNIQSEIERHDGKHMFSKWPVL